MPSFWQTLNITCIHFLSFNSETIFHIHAKWGITLRRHWISYQHTAKQSVFVPESNELTRPLESHSPGATVDPSSCLSTSIHRGCQHQSGPPRPAHRSWSIMINHDKPQTHCCRKQSSRISKAWEEYWSFQSYHLNQSIKHLKEAA